MKATSHKPAGFHTVTPGLCVTNAARLIEFITTTFDGQVLDRVERPDGGIMHAQMRVGDSMVEMNDGTERFPARPCSLHIYVPDADAVYRRALANGAKSLYEPVDQFYGDREAGVEDPTGNYWFIATHVEDLTAEEMAARMART
jgi:uncharacterized glyoxalase superfamily protein PhnB